jgi:hypothetical protein
MLLWHDWQAMLSVPCGLRVEAASCLGWLLKSSGANKATTIATICSTFDSIRQTNNG